MVEEMAMHFVGLLPYPGQPGAQCPFFDFKHPFQERHIHTLCHQSQNQRYFGRRCFQTIEGRFPMHTELSATGLTAQILDGVALAVPTVPNQGMDAFVPIAKIVAIPVGVGISLGGASFLSSALAFHFRPGLGLPWKEDYPVYLFCPDRKGIRLLSLV